MGRAETTAFPRLPLNSFRCLWMYLSFGETPRHLPPSMPPPPFRSIGAAGDVVNTGLVSNLARPDPNLTGFIALNVDLEGKRVEWLKEAMPRLSRIAVLTNPGNPISRLNVDIARQAAEKLGVKIEVVEAKNAAEVDGALAQITQLHPDAALIASDTQLLSKRKEIAEFMASEKIPALYLFREYANVGGLFIYGARAADYLDKLLKGEKIANLPV
ncbi:MAG: ABC transporter substrate-binding protein [Pseudolabrys sp.]